MTAGRRRTQSPTPAGRREQPVCRCASSLLLDRHDPMKDVARVSHPPETGQALCAGRTVRGVTVQVGGARQAANPDHHIPTEAHIPGRGLRCGTHEPFFFGLIALTIFLSAYFGFCTCNGGVVTLPA